MKKTLLVLNLFGKNPTGIILEHADDVSGAWFAFQHAVRDWAAGRTDLLPDYTETQRKEIWTTLGFDDSETFTEDELYDAISEQDKDDASYCRINREGDPFYVVQFEPGGGLIKHLAAHNITSVTYYEGKFNTAFKNGVSRGQVDGYDFVVRINSRDVQECWKDDDE